MIKLDVHEQFEAHRSELSVAPHEDPAHYRDLMEKLKTQLIHPSQVLDLRSSLSEQGYVLITTNLPEFAPRTPLSLDENYAGPYYGEALLTLVGSVVGELQSLSHQNNGRVYHDVMPIAAFSDKQTSASSDVTLEMHTELAFVENPPDYLMLFCVRQDPDRQAETHLYDSRIALHLLPEDQFTELTKSRFHFGLDANVTGSVGETGGPLPIFDAATSRLLRFDLDLYRSVGSCEDAAFGALTEALLAVRIAVRMRVGQLVLVDNKRMVHSRSRFTATYDGRDRWLKRSLVRAY